MCGLSDERVRCCKLTFVGSCQSTEPIDFGHLRRVREPVSRSKSSVQAKIADVFCGRSRHAESQNELKAFRVLLATGHPCAWQEQPFVLHYHHQGAKHRYTPDILIDWGAHQEVVEVTEDSDADLPENQSYFALLRELLAEHGYTFRVWRKSEICAEPRLTNVGIMLRYRRVDIPAAQQEKIRRAFSTTPELPLSAFSQFQGVPVQYMLRLVLDSTLHIDWWDPLGLQPRVSIAPIGKQVWPSPLSSSQTFFQEDRWRCMR
jgi:hypothetical protein